MQVFIIMEKAPCSSAQGGYPGRWWIVKPFFQHFDNNQMACSMQNSFHLWLKHVWLKQYEFSCLSRCITNDTLCLHDRSELTKCFLRHHLIAFGLYNIASIQIL